MFLGDVNIDHNPSEPNACPKIEPKSWNVEVNDDKPPISVLVTPIGIPIKVVTNTEIKKAPGTFETTNNTKIISPINAKMTDGSVKVAISGVVPPLLVRVSIVLAPPPLNGVLFKEIIFSAFTK